jgi:hypothetical protein
VFFPPHFVCNLLLFWEKLLVLVLDSELIFELVDGFWRDHAIDACQFVSEGDQRVIGRTAFGCCHDGVLLLFTVGEHYG